MTTDSIKFSTGTQISYNNSKINIEAGKSVSSIFTFKIDENIKNIMAKDGNKEDLTYEDLQYADELIGKYGIKNVRKDGNAKVVTLVFENGQEMKFNFKGDEAKANDNHKAKIISDLQKAGEFGLSEKYDITLSDDGKYYEIKVNTRWYEPDPKAITIIKDFGLKDNHIIYEANKENYPDYKVKTTYHDKYGTPLYETDYTNAIFDNGTKFRLPVEAVNIEDDVTGFWGKIIDRICSHGYEY